MQDLDHLSLARRLTDDAYAVAAEDPTTEVGVQQDVVREAVVSTETDAPLAGAGFEVREWVHGSNAGPKLHVHYSDDEAWHVLDGTLEFRFRDRTVEVGPGTTVMAPAGVPHTYRNPGPGDARYLIITSPRVFAMIDAMHTEGLDEQALAEVIREADSEDLE